MFLGFVCVFLFLLCALFVGLMLLPFFLVYLLPSRLLASLPILSPSHLSTPLPTRPSLFPSLLFSYVSILNIESNTPHNSRRRIRRTPRPLHGPPPLAPPLPNRRVRKPLGPANLLVASLHLHPLPEHPPLQVHRLRFLEHRAQSVGGEEVRTRYCA